MSHLALSRVWNGFRLFTQFLNINCFFYFSSTINLMCRPFSVFVSFFLSNLAHSYFEWISNFFVVCNYGWWHSSSNLQKKIGSNHPLCFKENETFLFWNDTNKWLHIVTQTDGRTDCAIQCFKHATFHQYWCIISLCVFYFVVHFGCGEEKQ